MRRPFSSIALLMMVVLYVAIVCAGIRSAWLETRSSHWWASGLHTINAVLLGAATLTAYVKRGRNGLAWCGFAVFGWLHVFMGVQGHVFLPDLFLSLVVNAVVSTDHPAQAGRYYAIADAVMTLLYGLAGAVVGKVVAHAIGPDTRP